MFSSTLIQWKKILCKWFRKTYVLSEQNLSNKCRKILYHHFVFPEDVLLFVFALVTADTKGNSQPILKIALLTTNFILLLSKRACWWCAFHVPYIFFMILIIPSVSTSTTLKNQSKHNCNHFNIIFFLIEANQFWLCDECIYHIIELKAEIYNKLCKIYKL